MVNFEFIDSFQLIRNWVNSILKRMDQVNRWNWLNSGIIHWSSNFLGIKYVMLCSENGWNGLFYRSFWMSSYCYGKTGTPKIIFDTEQCLWRRVSFSIFHTNCLVAMLCFSTEWIEYSVAARKLRITSMRLAKTMGEWSATVSIKKFPFCSSANQQFDRISKMHHPNSNWP